MAKWLNEVGIRLLPFVHMGSGAPAPRINEHEREADYSRPFVIELKMGGV
jgi:hypothetical protein